MGDEEGMISQEQADQILNMLAEFVIEHYPTSNQILKDYYRHIGLPAEIIQRIRIDTCRFTDIPVTSVRISLYEYSKRIEMTDSFLEDRRCRTSRDNQPRETYNQIINRNDYLRPINLGPEWWGLDCQYPPTNEPVKLHPDYPLIGIEWEPQLTLLNYAGKEVYVHMSKNLQTNIVNNNEKCVVIFLSNKYSGYIDKAVENIELRTDPVKLEDLNTEIQKCQKVMEDIVKDIAKVARPVGIFLPAYPCTKHVNVSFKNVNNKYASICPLKGGDYGFRHHVKVPYNFMDYKSLLNPCGNFAPLIEPILLGYSYTGEVYTSMRELF
ncbi:MAG TPA: hypothetical protein VI727_08155 [Candidatus Brocadiaceae bacterium]|nr:hypothetical protein [Candidatus Brocadiaceae bacterium]